MPDPVGQRTTGESCLSPPPRCGCGSVSWSACHQAPTLGLSQPSAGCSQRKSDPEVPKVTPARGQALPATGDEPNCPSCESQSSTEAQSGPSQVTADLAVHARDSHCEVEGWGPDLWRHGPSLSLLLEET